MGRIRADPVPDGIREPEQHFGAIEGKPVDHPVGETKMGTWKPDGLKERSEMSAPVEPVEPFGIARGIGEELRLGRVGKRVFDDAAFALINGRSPLGDLRDFVPPVEETAPGVVGKASDSPGQHLVIVVRLSRIAEPARRLVAFVHISSVKRTRLGTLREGQRVDFELTPGRDECPPDQDQRSRAEAP